MAVSTSTSLLHVPHDVDDEPELDDRLRSWLAFADQKVGQVAVLARGLVDGRDAIEDQLGAATAALADRADAPGVRVPAVREREDALTDSDFRRGDYEHGAIEGVSAVGELLARHFPANGEHNPDQLPDRPVLL